MHDHRYWIRSWLLALLLPGFAPTSHAMQDGKPVIGLLAFDVNGCQNAAFRRGLSELGYVDGQNMILVCKHSGGAYALLDERATELLAINPDVIVVLGHAPAKAVQRHTKTIPIVMSASGEPVAIGFAQSLAHPGGNITGVSYYAIELNIKRLEFLKSIVPKLKHLAVLTHAGLPEDLNKAYLRDYEIAGKKFGFEVKEFKYKKLEDFEQVFADISASGEQALLITPTREVPAEIQRLVEMSRQYRLPIMHFRKSFPAAGGLISYGPDYAVLHHRTAYYVDRILKGANPASLPIEQPARIELHVNLSAAKALGLTLPESLLLRADKVIE